MSFGDSLPDACVISLDRLPSHGWHVAEWVWEAKERRHVPTIFGGGKPDKIAATKEKFPAALFSESDQASLCSLTTAEKIKSSKELKHRI